MRREETSVKHLILATPGLIALAVPFYNKTEPTLAGLPFYYWFLLALIPITTLCIYAAYKWEGR
jgi:hypothetical protein